jgi:23S rRNA (cytosine1962-C5)-methyltransferase
MCARVGKGKWMEKDLPKEWQIEFGGLKFLIKPTSFKHTGLVSRAVSNWEWMQKR